MATVRNLFIEGFSGEANTDVVATFRLHLTEDDNVTPFDLTDATSSFKAKRSYSDSTPVIVATTTDGITADANTGIVTLRLTVGHFSGVALNRESTEFIYDWDVRVDGELYRPLRGTLTIGGDI